jgi:ABC-type nitrate/sulfonate/bicarbonate transport system ATPase subunit
MPLVQASQLTRSFTRGRAAPLAALDPISFSVEAGSFASFVGPSGCGKSTLLRILAGLDTQTSGTLTIEGALPGSLLGVAGYMPQHDLLMPWRSVLDNATVALEFAGVPRREARARARALFPAFGLEGFEAASPTTLSGGMRQRVSLLRTILTGRQLLLLDEPFGALDAITRLDLQEWMAGVLATMHTTVILVTHDLEEAALLSDRVYVLSDRPGHIVAAIDVPLPRPRAYTITTTPAFAAIKRQLFEALREGRRTTRQISMVGAEDAQRVAGGGRL